MQNDQDDEKRTLDETDRVTREVMKRMLMTPPTPHVAKKAAKKKSKPPKQ